MPYAAMTYDIKGGCEDDFLTNPCGVPPARPPPGRADGYADGKCDELLLFPCTADTVQLNLIAKVAFS